MKDYLIDTHAHIDMMKNPDTSGVGKIIVPAVEYATLEKVVALSNTPNIFSMVGIYPSEAKTYNQDVIECLVEGIEHPESHYVSQKFSSGKAVLDNILGHTQVKG